jgi:U3 small nucleolar RNA-associated protein 14
LKACWQARGEKLRKRIPGVGSDESQEENDEDDGDWEVDLEEGIAKVKQDAFDELAKLDDQEEVGGDCQNGKSVFEMKFMKDAMARQAAATNKEVMRIAVKTRPQMSKKTIFPVALLLRELEVESSTDQERLVMGYLSFQCEW